MKAILGALVQKKWVTPAILALGVILRLRHFLENRSLWQDELCLALSIVHRPFHEIWQHKLLFPDFAQAPLFFQLI
ncbi:MAG: hypothetical protein GX606_01255, partial [Elusimicrobia bacterium]|nr:hypothetical protein [Elusimicrobiota bacterium]